ncbi:MULTISPECIES: hypothetical protein [Xanthomarina]|jgi:hypothetical protein|uniref:hypothetical protein n=1 Tax=Xanthomarina TaxID=1868329 RepID=UPI00257BAA25|nr:hypothetical protein [Xanthomarina sp.]MDX1317372.1 hypothetical protein [Xanthomarina gelatinilytica]|tara:strand:+ start:283 stop:576 length:294 start_codon:yes stop_codon:yes gene_type:complete
MMMTQNKRVPIILTTATILLLIPFIAMQFSTEVNWSAFDFLIAGILLFGTGFLIELVLRKVTKKQNRWMLLLIIISLVLLTWIELAVGLFGTPLAGS